jgi:hypothetical protein
MMKNNVYKMITVLMYRRHELLDLMFLGAF